MKKKLEVKIRKLEKIETTVNRGGAAMPAPMWRSCPAQAAKTVIRPTPPAPTMAARREVPATLSAVGRSSRGSCTAASRAGHP
ncbi:hypothetical protein [Nonomuraea jiangxiensis]|uniref:Uncharacterized protein n=1 Tax=Nonomuraea jiangxiensis TaxID=633440 RepID=A0A1G9IB49_9ACTN|nr:hypothetical protein [Nonomuraea jiangxiensis]SDL22336.1 hypothetical protein SAMN05421869_123131 [Nonomuraea jiangxiensis]